MWTPNSIYILGAILFLHVINADVPKSQEVKCAVCRSLIEELHDAINKVDPRKTIDVGSFRIGADGKSKAEPRQYAGSEVHMVEVLESICKEFADEYAQARHKQTGELNAIRFIRNGVMNPRFSEYEVVQDPDLNKGLAFHCEGLVEDFEDDIVNHMRKQSKLDIVKSQNLFCKDTIDVCPKYKDEL